MPVKLFITIAVVCLFTLAACNRSATDTTIFGTGSKGEKVSIFKVLADGDSLCETEVVSDSKQFSFQLKIPETAFYYVTHGDNFRKMLVITPGEKIELTADPARKTWNSTGSAGTTLFEEYLTFTENNRRKVDSLASVLELHKADPDFVKTRDQLDMAYSNIRQQHKDSSTAFVRKNINSIASLLVISQYFGPDAVFDRQSDALLFSSLDSALSTAYPTNKLVVEFHKKNQEFAHSNTLQSSEYHALTVGSKAPPIELQGISGKKVALATSEAKLNLVYFWASWNNDCRLANLELSAEYSKFHSKGLNIFAVALENNTAVWEQTIHLDKAYWTNVIDTKGLESYIAKKYGVKSLPAFFVVGTSGEIIMLNNGLQEVKTLIRNTL